MGREAVCHARLGRESGEGRALLETDELIFRGEFRARVPLREISALGVRAGVLTLAWPGGRLALALGEAAEKWADAIRNPKSVLEKLGVRAGQKVALVGRFEPAFKAEVSQVLGAPPAARAVKGCDLVFLQLGSPGDEDRLARLKPAIAPAGGIWAVYPKGRRDLSEDTVRAAARRAGLTDVKVVRFSERMGALKLVIPRAARA